MQKYKQLDLQARHQIKTLLDIGASQTKIAEVIGVHKFTISRELARNVAKRGPRAKTYRPDLAQKKTDHPHRNKRKHIRFTELLKQQATGWLEKEKLSPELINGRWTVHGTDGVSHEALCQWIWRGKTKQCPETKDLYRHLKHGRRRRKRGNYTDSRGRLKDLVSIEERPEVVEQCNCLGDLEIDLMIGKVHKSALLVITDRATLLTAIEKVTTRQADSIEECIHQCLAKKLRADVYFTRPYTSQDKGTVESRVGVIRRFFPKDTDLREVDTERIKIVERHLNNRPVRKIECL